MYGFTCRKEGEQHCFEHFGLQFRMFVNSDGSGSFHHYWEGNVVNVPSVDVINLGGFLNPQKFDNIRHDLIHVLYWYLRYGELSPNHCKLMSIGDTPLHTCHWEEYKVESLELYAMTGIKRELLGYYEQAKAFVNWMMLQLRE